MPKTYLLYARVSPKGSQWDCEETSIGVQIAEMRAHCERLDPGANFIEVFDEFKSGKNLKRPGVQKILADLEKRPVPWKCLVVWNLDRLSRSLADALPIFMKLRDADCEFISINQEFLTYHGAMGRFMLHQTIAIAELERGMCSERTSAKMRWIASEGKVPYGRLPFAFFRDPNLKNTVRVDQEKAEIVKTIFDLYVSGKLTFAEIDNRWPGVFSNRQTLYSILRQPLYIGELRYGGKIYEMECPAIIDRAVFDKAQALLALQKRQNYSRQGVQKYDFLLSGILRCHCGRMMTGYSVKKSNGQRFHYYRCTDNCHCKNAINAEALDSAVLQQIADVFNDEAEIKKSLSAFLDAENKKNSEIRARASDIEKELQAVIEKENRIKEMFLAGSVVGDNVQFWNAELSAARSARVSLEKQLAVVVASPVFDCAAIMPDLIKAAAEWSRRFLDGSASFEMKRNLVMSAVDDVQCVQRAGKEIRFKLSLVMSSSKNWQPNSKFIITSIFSMNCGCRGKFMRASIIL